MHSLTHSLTNLLSRFLTLSLLPRAEKFHPQSCDAIKTENPSAKNGAYTIKPLPGGSSYSVYCNMQDYGGGWTLVTLIKSDRGDQWNPAALYPGDLARFTTRPSRVSKLSDAEINALLGRGGTRWVTANTKQTFYRMTDRPWVSNHGKPNACSYKKDFYDAWAEPSTRATWSMAVKYIGCGGIYTGKEWLALSGIHANPWNNLAGAYDPSRRAWKQNGYVFVRSLRGLF